VRRLPGALLTVTEVARRYHVDQRTVLRWVEDGALPVERTLAGQRRFNEEAVQAVMALEDGAVEALEYRWQQDDEKLRRLEAFTRWLTDLDLPERKALRQTTTLTRIVALAREALGENETRG
jgi:excisionase family DNA binding protein